MKPSHKSSELYVVIYVLILLGTKYLGIDFSNVATQVQQVAGAYHGAAAGNSNQLLVLALAWLGARSGLKILDIRRDGSDGKKNIA